MEKLKATIIKIIAKELDVSPKLMKEETSIQEDLGADSLEVLNIAMAIEDKFNIEIDHNIMMEFTTIGSILDKIESSMSEN